MDIRRSFLITVILFICVAVFASSPVASAPQPTILFPENITTSDTVLDLNVSFSEPIINMTWELDDNGTLFKNTSANWNLTNGIVAVSEITHKLNVTGENGTGDLASSIVYFTIDTTTPFSVFTRPENKTYTTTAIPVNQSFSEKVDRVDCFNSTCFGKWHFESVNSTNNTIGIQGRVGTLLNFPTDPAVVNVSGRFGNALSFDGAGATIQVPSTSGDGTDGDEITFGAWAKPDSLSPTGSILTKGSSWELQLRPDGKVRCNIFRQTSGATIKDTGVGVGLVGVWKHYDCTYSPANGIMIYVNGVQIGATGSGGESIMDSNVDVWIGSSEEIFNLYTGLIDEPVVIGRELSADEMSCYYANAVGSASDCNYTFIADQRNTYNFTSYMIDSVGNTNVSEAPIFSSNTENASLQSVRFEIDDFNFSSTDYIEGVLASFTTLADDQHWTIFDSMDTVKLSGGGTRILSIRMLYDDVVIGEEEVRTFSGNNEFGTSGLRPVQIITGPVGVHNISVQFKMSGPGLVEISNVDIVAVKDRVFGTNNSVRHNVTQVDVSFTAVDEFDKIFNWTMEKPIASGTFLVMKWSLFKTLNDDANVTFQSDGGGEDDSPFFERYLEDNNAIGSMGMAYIDGDEEVGHNHSIIARQSDVGATVSINGSIFETDLRDNQSTLINSFQISRPETNITNVTAIPAGTFNILNQTVTMWSGTAYMTSAYASFSSSSGAFTPTFRINSTNSTLTQCNSTKRRTLMDDLDVGNTYMWMVCQNMTVGQSYELSFWVDVPAGETLLLKDESFGGFESTPFNTIITQVDQTPPTFTILSPLNTTINTNNTGNLLLINVTVIDSGGVKNVTYDINETGAKELINSSGNWNTQIASPPNGLQNITFNFTDNTGNVNTTIHYFTVDIEAPVLIINNPVPNSSVFGGNFNLDLLCTDNIELWSCGIELSNSTNSSIFLNETFNLTGLTSFSFMNLINITALNMPDGFYNGTFNGSDAKNNLSNKDAFKMEVDIDGSKCKRGSCPNDYVEADNTNVIRFTDTVTGQWIQYDIQDLDFKGKAYNTKVEFINSQSAFETTLTFIADRDNPEVVWIITGSQPWHLIHPELGQAIASPYGVNFIKEVASGGVVSSELIDPYTLRVTVEKPDCERNKECVIDPAVEGLNIISREFFFEIDTTGPTINLELVFTDTTEVVIRFNTSEPTNQTVFYGTTSGSLNQNTSQSSGLATSHVRTIGGLTASTVYYYIIEACDFNDNCINTTEDSFLTEPLALGGDTTGGPFGTGVTVLTPAPTGTPAPAIIIPITKDQIIEQYLGDLIGFSEFMEKIALSQGFNQLEALLLVGIWQAIIKFKVFIAGVFVFLFLVLFAFLFNEANKDNEARDIVVTQPTKRVEIIRAKKRGKTTVKTQSEIRKEKGK